MTLRFKFESALQAVPGMVALTVPPVSCGSRGNECSCPRDGAGHRHVSGALRRRRRAEREQG